MTEKDKGSLLQVYTPVMRNGATVGVIELYEANRDLFEQIARNTLFVEGLVAAAGLLLYLSFFAIFFRAYRSQRRVNEEHNRIMGVFGQHVSPEVVNRLLSQNIDQDGDTIVGDTVNVAKRIEELNKSLGSRLLVSEEVWNALGAKPRISKKVGRVRIKGHEAPILLYKVA